MRKLELVEIHRNDLEENAEYLLYLDTQEWILATWDGKVFAFDDGPPAYHEEVELIFQAPSKELITSMGQ